ncbi:BsuBIPstI restriction endonuclease domain protein (fragment) [Cupriavidus taiwanensis]
MSLLAAGKVKSKDEVLVNCPDGTVAKLSAGPSSVTSKAVIEEFSARFLKNPALLWLSESGEKVRYQDEKIAKAFGLDIDQSKVLPDIIMVDLGESGDTTHLIFIEVVSSDGAMSLMRRDALLEYVRKSGFPESQVLFGTAFNDRANPGYTKCVKSLAWGTFVWFRSEPDCLMWLHDEPFVLTNNQPKHEMAGASETSAIS